MIKIKFKNENFFRKAEFSVVGSNIVQLIGEIPENTSGFGTYKLDETELGDFSDYRTVYRKVDGGIRFSNDGSVYVEHVPTLEELKERKKQVLSALCEQTIYGGISVELESGTEHFSLTEKDQINLFGKQMQLAAGAAQLEYHQDGHPCRYYTAGDMQKICAAAVSHVSYHTTYCNSLFMWLDAVDTKEELDEIYYGADVPEEYQSEVLKTYLAEIAAEGERAIEKIS